MKTLAHFSPIHHLDKPSLLELEEPGWTIQEVKAKKKKLEENLLFHSQNFLFFSK